MKHPFIRRAMALTLALVFSLTLSLSLIAPGRAKGESGGNLSITGAPEGKKLEVDETATLKAAWDVAPTPADGGSITYKWEITQNDTYVEIVSGAETDTLTVKGVTVGTATVKLTATWTEKVEEAEPTPTPEASTEPTPEPTESPAPEESPGAAAEETKTVTAEATLELEVVPVPVTGVKLPATLGLVVGGDPVTLTATVEPENATNKNVTWKSSDESVATVTGSGTTVTVTGVKVGSATITVTTVDGGKTATCAVTVAKEPVSLSIADGNAVLWNSKTTNRTLSVLLTGVDEPEKAEITWTVGYLYAQDKQKGVLLPTLEGTGTDGKSVTSTDGKVTSVGPSIKINEVTAGEFTITASYTDLNGVKHEDTCHLTISGIVLSGTRLDADKGVVTMYVNGSTALDATPYGDADDRNATQVEWVSSDSAVVSVMIDAGNLNAWGVGEAVITATKGDYKAECTVKVEEDTSVIADNYEKGGYPASASEPLKLSAVYRELNKICQDKTEDSLSYITNVRVTFTDQGTLYYNYSTESDPGDGVGSNEQFALTATGSRRSLDRLSFVPRQGFSGTADINFTGVAANGRNFAGIIRVNVSTGSSGSSGEDSETRQITYRTQAGEPAWFLASDFSIYCQQHPNSGRDFNYIMFNLPKSSEGTLYYNYVAGSGNPVSTSIQFTQSGRYSIDNVCFVPNAAYAGEAVTISFRAVDTTGATVNGKVTVNIVALSAGGDASDVKISGERGRPVALQSELFNAACQTAVHDTLHFVTFTLPDPDVGTLYVNYQSEKAYGSRVIAGTRCYYSGTPGLSSVSFVPASNAAGRVAISYTGYSTGGAAFGGTLYITLGEVNRSEIHYSVTKGGTVTFSASDFKAAGQHMGSSVSFVKFTGVDPSSGLSSASGLGTLRWRSTSTSTPQTITPSSTSSVSTTTAYFVSPTGSQRGLSRVYFDAKNTAGTVTIFYTAYSGTTSKYTELFKGTVEIQVGNLSPEDVSLSCRTGGQAALSASTLNSVCGAVMSGSMSYIEITSVPDPEEGRLYFNYSGFGTGTVVKQGDRYYRVGSDNISQLTFVPHARFTGSAEITYIAYSGDGLEQVSGRIVVSVTTSTSSQYFTDMGSRTWAMDSVDYLYRNGVVDGVSKNCFNPGGTVIRGDFVLMLVRAYGFTASGSASFADVPAGSYYADAISIAYQNNIVSGSGGYFRPKDALTRQDAMVMIYNALKASGKTTTNGLAADFSGYVDEKEISGYAREAMGSLLQMGVIEGVGNDRLDPRGQLTRAQAAMLLHTIMTL